MVLQPDNLAVDTNSRGPIPLRILPDQPGGCQSRKFAAVASALTLPIGTPVSYRADLDAWVAWDPTTGAPADVNEVQELNIPANADGGTFALVFGGEITSAIAFNADAATIETAFEALSTVGAGNGTIAGSAGGPFSITFTGDLAGAPQELVQVDGSLLTDGGDAAGGATVTRVTAGVTGGEISEVQTLTITGTPDDGTFTLTFDGQTTDPIDFDATAAEVELALEALSNVGAGNATCSGGDLPGTAVVITFTGDLAGADVPLIFVDGSLLDGGTDPAATIAVTVGGSLSEGADAPAGKIRGFVYPSEIVLSTLGEKFATVMLKGEIHRGDIPLPTVGSPTEAQLDEALRDGLLERGLIVQGLSSIL